MIDAISGEIQTDLVYLHTTFRVFRAFRVPVADAKAERAGGGTLEGNIPSPFITIQKIDSRTSELSESVVIKPVSDEIQTHFLPSYSLPSLPSFPSSKLRPKCGKGEGDTKQLGIIFPSVR